MRNCRPTRLFKTAFRRCFFGVFCIFLALFWITGCTETVMERPDGMTTSTIPTSTQPQKKRVALTFDDGPNHYDNRTKNTVDELAKYGFRATFFVVGNRVSGGDTLEYAVAHGCEIGIHGFTHEKYYDECTDAEYQNELNHTLDAIHRRLPDYNVRLMRPPGGDISSDRLAACPYSVILWNVDSLDYHYTYKRGDSDDVCLEKVNTIVDNVMTTVSDGSIILMHDIYESTQDAVVLLLARLYAEGYEVVTVSELLGDSLAPGRIYYSK